MHIVIEDNFDDDEKMFEVNNILKRINNYFNENFHMYSIFLQPELSKVRVMFFGIFFLLLFFKFLVIE